MKRFHGFDCFLWRLSPLVAAIVMTACSDPAPPPAEDTAAPARTVTSPDVREVTSKADLEPLFVAVADRRFVLLGESTHGTHEYYYWRDRISRRLVREKGFRFVAVEGDWVSICRLNQYVNHRTPDDLDLRTLLRSLERWPGWMWGNEVFERFLESLRQKNALRPAGERIGVYGLDMQDPQASMTAVMGWVKLNQPERLDWVRNRYGSVHGVPDGFRRYAHGLAHGAERLRENFVEVADWLRTLQAAAPDDPALFSTKMNALAVVSAEDQYAAMVRGGPESWNVRARFMDKTFRRLAQRYGDQSRGIVWAHNTHVGDAAATEMRQRGEVNIGQLLRQEFGPDQVYILGFATSGGTVAAGATWGAPMQVMNILPPRQGSLEAALEQQGLDKAIFFFGTDGETGKWEDPLPHRAIGVVYRPPHEAYVMTVPSQRYDALFYIRETRALAALQ